MCSLYRSIRNVTLYVICLYHLYVCTNAFMHVQTHIVWVIEAHDISYAQYLFKMYDNIILRYYIYIYMHTSIEREDRVLPCVLVYTHVVYACVLGYMHIHTQRQTCRPKGPTNKHSHQSWFKCRNPKIPLVTWWNLSTFEGNPPHPKKKTGKFL